MGKMFIRWTSLRSSLRLISPQSTKISSSSSMPLLLSTRLKSTAASPEDAEEDQPIKYSTSKGHGMHPSFLKKSDVEKWGYVPVRFEEFIVLFSLYAVLVYFCVLREESDLDEILKEGPQFNSDFLEGLGKRELENCLAEYSRQDLDGQRIVKRLAELNGAEGQQGAAPETEN